MFLVAGRRQVANGIQPRLVSGQGDAEATCPNRPILQAQQTTSVLILCEGGVQQGKRVPLPASHLFFESPEMLTPSVFQTRTAREERFVESEHPGQVPRTERPCCEEAYDRLRFEYGANSTGGPDSRAYTVCLAGRARS